MKTFLPGAFVTLAVLLSALNGKAEDAFALRPNDTVVFYGDSITDQRMYTAFTELYVVTRYPKLNVNFVHSGWGGDRVTGGGGGKIDLRLERDVVAYHPTVMTIMLGMNDGGYGGNKPSDDTVYYAGYRHIIESMEKAIPNLRITVIGPSPFDDVTRPVAMLQPEGYNSVMIRYSEFARRLAEEDKLCYADFNSSTVAMLKKASATEPAVAQQIIPDRVHPGWAGHLIMAEQLLKAWHARPIVSAVTIDADARKVTESEFAAVTELHTSGPLKWTQTDEALPLPFQNLIADDHDKTIALAIKSSDVTAGLNAQPLTMLGLKPGKYKLMIDGDSVGNFTDGELAEGINLAILDTPMSKQAMTVRDLTLKRLDVHQQRWRTLQVPMEQLELKHLDEALKALDTLDAELAARQHEAAQPVPHDFELVALEK